MIRIPKLYLSLSAILIGLSLLSFHAAAQNNFKFSVVDTQSVVESYKKAQEASEVLKTADDRLRAKLKALEEEILAMENRLAKQKLFLDEPSTETFENDILRKRQEYQRELKIGQEALIEKQKELLEPIVNEIEDQIQQIGKSEGYSLILEKRLVTVYVDPKYDLTDSVIRLLNKRYEQEKSGQNDKKSSAAPKKKIEKEK